MTVTKKIAPVIPGLFGATKSPEIVMSIEDVTPELAKEWLTKNFETNRKLHNKVDDWADEMASGDWHLTHQGIAFDGGGRLVDGQNRLSAIVKSGATVRLCVFIYAGLAPMGSFDVGRARKLGDALAVRGLVGRAESSAIAAVLISLQRGITGQQKTTLTTDDAARAFHAHGDGIAWVQRTVGTARTFIAPVRAALAYAYPVDPAKVNDFTVKVATLAGIENESPEQALRQWLDGQRGSQAKLMRGRADERNNVFYRTLAAVQKRFAGETVRRLQAPRGENGASMALQFFRSRRQAMGLPVGIES